MRVESNFVNNVEIIKESEIGEMNGAVSEMKTLINDQSATSSLSTEENIRDLSSIGENIVQFLSEDLRQIVPTGKYFSPS